MSLKVFICNARGVCGWVVSGECVTFLSLWASEVVVSFDWASDVVWYVS